MTRGGIMCGIFGYIGPLTSLRTSKRNDAAKIVFDGLKRLEYRGYDSWGIVAIENLKSKNENLIVEKHVGKIGDSNLKSKIFFSEGKLRNLKSNIALGHTRWATHGGVTQTNAHPHLDCTGQLAIVHNGIVENYQEIKAALSGHKFRSETDTEVVAHLVEELSRKMSFKEAVRKAFLSVKGLNSFIFLERGGEIIAVKNGSPLVIGLGKGENLLSSDPSALLPFTKKVIFLEDSQLAKISNDKVDVFEANSAKKIKVKVSRLAWHVQSAELGNFPHFMLKEIYEQARVLRIIAANGRQIESLSKIIRASKGTFFIGCGTASYAALSGTYLFSSVAKAHVNFSIGSEFNYLEHYLNEKSLVIAISQSGETIDVVQPAMRAKEKKAKIVVLTNVEGSTLFRLSDFKILLNAGPEKAVCATKSYIAMVANLICLAFALSGKGGEGRRQILKAADAVEEILKDKYVLRLKKLAKRLRRIRDIYIIGRGLSYPSALEATLKLKEVAYVHSEGFAAGELKHGVIALIEKGTPCVVFAPNDETYQDIISNAIEIKSRGGFIVGVSPKNNEVFDFWLPVADCKEASIIPNIVPIQLLAYFLAVEKGLDPDKPRNLAKSVTVK